MTSSVKKAPVKRWVDESLKDPRFKEQSTILTEMVCPKIELTDYVRKVPAKGDQLTNKRWSTEYWLSNMIVRENIQFRDFLTISFYKPNKDIIKQYADNKHIKNVILHFFYNTTRPTNPIRIWFFNEREGMFIRQGKNQNLELVQSGDLHIHILLERPDFHWWRSTRNRNITMSKRTMNKIWEGTCSEDELMRESLTNHLKERVIKIPKSKQGVDIIDPKSIKKRISYVNKSLSSVEFDKWDHIDYEYSDVSICPIEKPKLPLKIYKY